MAGKGKPKGFVGNPIGKNQYVNQAGFGERTARLSVRISPELDEAIRKDAQAQGRSLTDWIEEAFRQKLDS